jgi:hypothetical protein
MNISSKDGTMFVSIARIDADAKANARISIAAQFERPSTQAMTGIRMQPAIAIRHRRNITFDNGTDPDSGKFPEEPARPPSDPQSRAIRNPADKPRSRTLAERTALKKLVDADSLVA